MSAVFFAQWFCPCGQCYHQKVFKTITWLPLTRLQGNKQHRNSPEPSEPCLRYLHHTATLRNLPEPASGTYTSTHRNSPEPASGTYTSARRNSPEPSGTYNSTHRNSPEPSGTCLWYLHQRTQQLFGTFRNLPPEPTIAHTGPLRNLPELASGTYTSTHRNSPEPPGTCLRNLHQHTPELSPGTFRNLPPEPAPATRTGTHRSLSGLKTPLAYAVGEKSSHKVF